jgi:glycosyltransferase involved in cell wall biosynthesis
VMRDSVFEPVQRGFSRGAVPPWELLVVRGDLRSHYGYGKALRAHVSALAPSFKGIVGVDLHYHPNRANEVFPGKILTDSEVDELISQAGGRVLLLNYSTPTQFRRHPLAYNVGLFYWETDRFAASTGWSSLIQLMDEMWIPTEFMRSILVREGFQGPIECFPWPQSELTQRRLNAHEEKDDAEKIDVPLFRMPPSGTNFRALVRWLVLVQQLISRIPGLRRVFRRISLHRMVGIRLAQKYRCNLEGDVTGHSFVHLAVAQNTPRKGLPLLLAGWLDFREQNPESRSSLVLKVGTLNVDFDAYDLYFELVETISRMAVSRGIEETHIYLALDYFNESQMNELYRRCTGALLSTTLGEGFGGPVAEAAMRGVPVICPRHTSLADLLPSDYPLVAAHDMRHLSMKNLLGVYSLSSVWGLVREGELATQIKKVESLTDEERVELVGKLRSRLDALCGSKAIAGLLEKLMERVTDRDEAIRRQSKKKVNSRPYSYALEGNLMMDSLHVARWRNGGAHEARG